MPRLRRIAGWIIACTALVACTRDFDSVFGDGGASLPPDAGVDGPATAVDSGGEDVALDAANSADAGVCTSCEGGACDIVCAPGCPCSGRACNDATCRFVCHPGASCVVSSTNAGATTTLICKPGSTCAVTCEGPSCNVDCQGDAKCKQHCTTALDSNCTMTCGSGTTNPCTSGSDERRACNDTCPN